MISPPRKIRIPQPRAYNTSEKADTPQALGYALAASITHHRAALELSAAALRTAAAARKAGIDDSEYLDAALDTAHEACQFRDPDVWTLARECAAG